MIWDLSILYKKAGLQTIENKKLRNLSCVNSNLVESNLDDFFLFYKNKAN